MAIFQDVETQVTAAMVAKKPSQRRILPPDREIATELLPGGYERRWKCCLDYIAVLLDVACHAIASATAAAGYESRESKQAECGCCGLRHKLELCDAPHKALEFGL